MTTLYISDPVFLDHITPEGHPERVDRLRAIDRVMSDARFDKLLRHGAVAASSEAGLLVHPEAYIARILATNPVNGFAYLDGDTSMSPGSLNAALHAIGSVQYAVDTVLNGGAQNAFLAARPPGHHAETAHAMGFCLFNTIGIAARHAKAKHGVERVAIVDWDVHHGNGTQDVFWADKSVLFVSSHQMPLFPGSGASNETGLHNTIVNVPLRAGDDGATFREAFRERVLPRLRAFQPDLILISAGFDAHKLDPIADLRLEAADFAWATLELMDVADRYCKGRIVSLLEGGYSLEGLSQSVAAHMQALMSA